MAFSFRDQLRFDAIPQPVTKLADDLAVNLAAIRNTLTAIGAQQLSVGTWATELTAAGKTDEAALVAGMIPLSQEAVSGSVNPIKISEAVEAVKTLTGNPPSMRGMKLVDGSNVQIETA